MKDAKHREFWGKENGRLAPWEFGIRVFAVAVVLLILTKVVWSVATGSSWLELSQQQLKDAAVIFAAYIVLAIRRERHDWVFGVNTAIWLGLAIAWFESTVAENPAWAFVLLLTTVVGALIAPFLSGHSIFFWQRWPADSPATQFSSTEAGPSRWLVLGLVLLLTARFVARRPRRRSTANGSQG